MGNGPFFHGGNKGNQDLFAVRIFQANHSKAWASLANKYGFKASVELA